MLLGSLQVKAAHKHVGEIEPRFLSFYARLASERKNITNSHTEYTKDDCKFNSIQFDCKLDDRFQKKTFLIAYKYRCTSLYARDRDSKNRHSYNEFAY